MTRKASRGRKTTARARTSTARGQARTTTRTGRKTASARASKTATPLPRNSQARPAKRAATPVASRPSQTMEGQAMHEPLPAAQHEDDEDMDWLGEDEDPRSQIVEDDGEWDPQSDDEW
jgi:hypothetical protein